MHTNETHPPISDSIKQNVFALIDARRLAIRCQELEESQSVEAQRRAELEAQLDAARENQERTASLAAFGQRELNRLANETRARLRTLADNGGESDRVEAFDALAQATDLQPEEILRWHRRALEEVRALFPTRPASRIDVSVAQRYASPRDWAAFQMRPADRHPTQVQST